MPANPKPQIPSRRKSTRSCKDRAKADQKWLRGGISESGGGESECGVCGVVALSVRT